MLLYICNKYKRLIESLTRYILLYICNKYKSRDSIWLEYTTEFDQIAAGAGGNKYITAIAAIIFLYVYFNFAAAAGGNFYLPAVINILPRLPRLFSSMFILTLPPPPAVISICRR